MEAKLFEGLFKVDGALLVDVNSESFISNLLPLIKRFGCPMIGMTGNINSTLG